VAGGSELLACHRRLAGLTGQMLALARAGRWKDLPVLDAQCMTHHGQLQALASAAPEDDEREAIALLVERIGADQAELNTLVRPQFVALMERMGGQRRPHARMRGRNTTHDPEKCPPGGARSSAGDHAH
jgi:hypothetical protein